MEKHRYFVTKSQLWFVRISIPLYDRTYTEIRVTVTEDFVMQNIYFRSISNSFIQTFKRLTLFELLGILNVRSPLLLKSF